MFTISSNSLGFSDIFGYDSRQGPSIGSEERFQILWIYDLWISKPPNTWVNFENANRSRYFEYREKPNISIGRDFGTWINTVGECRKFLQLTPDSGFTTELFWHHCYMFKFFLSVNFFHCCDCWSHNEGKSPSFIIEPWKISMIGGQPLPGLRFNGSPSIFNR